MGYNTTLPVARAVPVPVPVPGPESGTGASTSTAAVRRSQADPPLVRWGLTLAAVAVVFVLIVIPVVNVFYQALANGLGGYWRAIALDRDTRAAIALTLTVAPIAV